MIYLDYNATTPLRAEVRSAMEPWWQDDFANPQSPHQAGQRARQAIETARDQIRTALGVGRDWEVIFTGSGTEADNLAVRGILGDDGQHGLLTSPIEHKAVLAAAAPKTIIHYFPVGAEGVVQLTPELPWASVGLVSLMLANNETGAIQPVAEVAQSARAAGVPLHCDAVQAFGRIPIVATELGVDLISVSAHKIGGPKGVGALIVRPGLKLVPIIRGGSHENGHRAGTHNVPGIVGFGEAAQWAHRDLAYYQLHTSTLRDTLLAGLRGALPDLILLSETAPRLPNTLLIAFPGCQTQTLLAGFDLAGVAAGAGAACAAGGVDPSHVVKAMCLPDELARAVVRFSLGRETTATQVTEAISLISQVVKGQRCPRRSIYSD
jgi:cysteine desulfurase